MSNYPPGTSAGDPRAPWNAPDHSHDHEWRPSNGDYPLFEDGAAVFAEYCEYSEGRYGDGWSCEETRWIRCDIERIVKVRDGEPNIEYLATEENHSMHRYIERMFEEAIVALEAGSTQSIEIERVDPPNGRGDGYVRVAVRDYILIYEE
jgi:hypothetical protein